MLDKNKKGHDFFGKIGEKILSLRWFLIVAVVIMTIVSLVGVKKIVMDPSMRSFLSQNTDFEKSTKIFQDKFGNNDYAAVLIEAKDVFQPDILKMIKRLGTDLKKNVPFADRIMSITDYEFTEGIKGGMKIDNIIPGKIPETKDQIEKLRKKVFSKQFLVNRLFSDDSKETLVILHLKNPPENWLKKHKIEPVLVIGKAVLDVIKKKEYQKYNLKATGFPVISYEKTVSFIKDTRKTSFLIFIAGILILIVFLRSVSGLLIPLFTTVSSILIVYGMMGFLGIKINNTFMASPMFLGFSLSIGYSIHIINFFKRKFSETGNRREAVLFAIQQTGWPILFTALTTVVCLLSFIFLPVQILSWLALTASAVIIVVYIIVMSLTPALLSFGKDKSPETLVKTKEKFDKSDSLYINIGDLVFKRSKILIIIMMTISIFMLIQTFNVRISTDYRSTIGYKLDYMKRVDYINNTKIGSLYSYNVLVEFKNNDQIKDPLILNKFEKLKDKINTFKLTKRTWSVNNILKDINRSVHENKEEYYRIPESKMLVNQLLFLYESSGGKEAKQWVDTEDGFRTLRIMVEIKDFDSHIVEKEIEIIKAYAKQLFPDATVMLTGVTVEYSLLNNYISRSVVFSIGVSLLMIFVLMFVLYRNIKVALIGMVPNLAPVVVAGGIMGLFNIGIEMISVTIFPMLIGIAVDDTIHFISHVKMEVNAGKNYDEAISYTFKTVGKSVFLTTLIITSTFAMTFLSDIQGRNNMGLLVVSGLWFALLADYIITPTLLRKLKPFK